MFESIYEEYQNTVMIDDDFYKLLFRFSLNIIALVILIRYIYYRKTQRKDYLFTYFMISISAFMLCFALKKLEIDIGMGIGLFAILGIIRYRTAAMRIKDMTYLFTAICISVVNAISGKQVSMAELIFINVAILGMVYGLEYWWLVRQESSKTIIYEKIDLVKPENHEKLMTDLEERTGLHITKIQIGKMDFLKDTAQVKIYFHQDEQDEYYPEDRIY